MDDRAEAGPGLTIRRGRPADAGFIVGLGSSAFSRFGEYGPIMEGFLASPDVTAFVAWAGGERVGFAMVDVPPSHAGLADLVAIAVAEPHRRNGVGRALLAHVIAAFSSGPRPSLLVLTVAGDNDGALALFRSEGFEIVPGSIGRYAGGQTSWRMVRADPGR
jgi:ribosomal-protein-alanine N-acetyltransferase